MSKAIDELREHFNQRPVPNSKVIIEERNKVNAMIDAVESENDKLRELVLHTVECVRRLSDTSENGGCVPCPYQSIDYDCDFENRARELGVGVDDGTE